MNSLKVSVIIPVYKVPLEYLRACLDSLTAQTLQECEFIIVSDGAPKAESSICEDYEKKDVRFRFFKRIHAGVSATRNYGIEQAQGEYITFVDSDDILYNKALESCYKHAKQWNNDILVFNYAKQSSQGEQTYQEPWHSTSLNKISEIERISILQEFIHLKQNSIPRGVCGKIYLKRFIKNNKISFNEKINMGEDLLFNFYCFTASANISYLSKTYYLYRYNSKSATNSFDPNYFYNRIAPILEIKKNFPNKYENLTNHEIIAIFFQSWQFCYMNPLNKQSLRIRVKKIKQIIYDNFFQSILANTTTKDMSRLIQLELFLFKHKITFPIWLHAFKARIIKQ